MSVNTKLNKLKKDDLVAICSSKKVEIPASAKTKPNIIAFMVAYDKWDSPLDTIVDQYMGGSAPAPAKAEPKAAEPTPAKAEPKAAAPSPVKPEIKTATPTPAVTKPEVKGAAPAPSINIDDIVKQVTPKVLAEVMKQLPAQAPKTSTVITTSSSPSFKMDEIVKEVMFQLSLKNPASPQPAQASPAQPQKPAGGADPAALESLTKRVNDLASTVQQLKQSPSHSSQPSQPQKPASGSDATALDNLNKRVNDLTSTVQQLKQSASQPAKSSGGPDAAALDNIKKQVNDLNSAIQQLKQSHSQPTQPQKPAGGADTTTLDNLTKRMNQLESIVKSDVAGMRNNLESIKQDIKSKLPAQAASVSKSVESKDFKSEIKIMAEIMEAIPPEPTHLTDVFEFLENISQVKFQEMLKFLLMMGLVEGEEAEDDLKIELADGAIVGQVKKK